MATQKQNDSVPPENIWSRCELKLPPGRLLSLPAGRPLERMLERLLGVRAESVGVCWLFSFCVVTLLFGFLMWCGRSLGPENLLLKGATLKNTQKICGKSKKTSPLLQSMDVFRLSAKIWFLAHTEWTWRVFSVVWTVTNHPKSDFCKTDRKHLLEVVTNDIRTDVSQCEHLQTHRWALTIHDVNRRRNSLANRCVGR